MAALNAAPFFDLDGGVDLAAMALRAAISAGADLGVLLQGETLAADAAPRGWDDATLLSQAGISGAEPMYD